jgi:hypothetical protein
MKEQKHKGFELIGKIMFFILFFIFLSALADNPVKQEKNQNGYELVSSLSSTANAILADTLQNPDFQIRWISTLDRYQIKYSCTGLKLLGCQLKIVEDLKTNKRAQLIIRPTILCRSCYLFLPADSREFPALS